MDWHQDDTWIDDYVDGAMSADAARDANAHLAACDRCRATVADFQALRTMSRALEPHVPPAHVWTRLAAAVDTDRRPSSFFPFAGFGLQQAAALLMAAGLTTGLWWVGDQLMTTERRARFDGGATVLTAGIGNVTLQLAEQEFRSTIAGLQQMTTDQRDALDPETADVLQANLTVIDSAIDQSRAVLAMEPESELAQDSLFEALRSKIVLLQEMLALINEMRKGNPEAAARIVSGLNQ